MEKTLVVAIIDDEPALRETLTPALSSEGYAVKSFPSASEGLVSLAEQPPDLIILDIIMPGMDGREFCRRWRGIHPLTPILFLSSRSGEEEKVEALGLGADDYLTKPFSLAELLIRIKVCFLRQQRWREGEANSLQKFPGDSRVGDFVLQPEPWRILYREQSLGLTVTEFRILSTLIGSPDRVFSREQLIAAAYPDDLFVSDRNVDAHIRRIRRKIQGADPAFQGIQTVYGVGYRFTL